MPQIFAKGRRANSRPSPKVLLARLPPPAVLLLLALRLRLWLRLLLPSALSPAAGLFLRPGLLLRQRLRLLLLRQGRGLQPWLNLRLKLLPRLALLPQLPPPPKPAI